MIVVELNSVTLWWVRQEIIPGATFTTTKIGGILQHWPAYYSYCCCYHFVTPQKTMVLISTTEGTLYLT
jgi:hypothetical protein